MFPTIDTLTVEAVAEEEKVVQGAEEAEREKDLVTA
jgi:hypothetical protein